MANQKTDDRSQEKENMGGSPGQQGNQPGQEQHGESPDRGSDLGQGSRSNVGGSQSGDSGNREKGTGLSKTDQDEDRESGSQSEPGRSSDLNSNR